MKQSFFVPIATCNHFYNHEFKDIDIDSLIEFVCYKAIDIIQESHCEESEIILCLPQYLIYFLSYEHANKTSEHGSKVVIDQNMHFCGIKVQVAFENKATIFFNSVIPDKIIKYTKEL